MTKEINRRIILVDDNDIDILVNTKLLKIASLSKDVVSFNSCDEVTAYCDERSTELESIPIVILMDIQMPECDGFECVERIAKLFDIKTLDFRIYMLSSSIDRGDIKRAEDNPNILKVLEKPLDIYQLKSLLED